MPFKLPYCCFLVLDYLSKYDKAEEVYTEILQLDPLGYYIGEFAIFLHRRKRDFDQAQSFYLKALQHWPEQATLHLKYVIYINIFDLRSQSP